MTKKANKTVVRTLRLDDGLNNYLIQEAKRVNISVSALTSQILSAYKDRYNFVEKLNPVAMTPGNFEMFLNCIDDKDLSQIAPKLASKLCLFKKHVFNDVNGGGGTVDWCLTNLLPQSHWFNCNRSSDGYMITHQMGPKWTLFLTNFLSTMIHSETGTDPIIDVDNEIIVIKTGARF